MEEYRLGICDSDINYAVSFMNYINMRDDIPLLVCVHSSVTELADAVRKGQLDIVLIDETLESELEEPDILVIRMGEAVQNDLYSRYMCKYRSIPDICEYILSFVGGKVAGKQNKSGKYLAVYMPTYNQRLEHYAVNKLAEYKDGLLIRLYEYRTYTGDEELSDKLMYYLLGHNEEIYKLIYSYISNDGLHNNDRVLYGPGTYVDIRELKRDDLEWFKHLVAEKTNRSTTVIFEIEAAVLSELECLLAFDRVYVPFLSDARSIARLNRFKEAIGHIVTGIALEKFIYVNVEEPDDNGGIRTKTKIEETNIGKH